MVSSRHALSGMKLSVRRAIPTRSDSGSQAPGRRAVLQHRIAVAAVAVEVEVRDSPAALDPVVELLGEHQRVAEQPLVVDDPGRAARRRRASASCSVERACRARRRSAGCHPRRTRSRPCRGSSTGRRRPSAPRPAVGGYTRWRSLCVRPATLHFSAGSRPRIEEHGVAVGVGQRRVGEMRDARVAEVLPAAGTRARSSPPPAGTSRRRCRAARRSGRRVADRGRAERGDRAQDGVDQRGGRGQRGEDQRGRGRGRCPRCRGRPPRRRRPRGSRRSRRGCRPPGPRPRAAPRSASRGPAAAACRCRSRS